MRKEDLKSWTREQMEYEILNLSDKNWNLEFRVNNYEESEGRLKDRNKSLEQKVESLDSENRQLKENVKSQREKIDSLFHELEEEKGKTITIGEHGMTMKSEMWDMVDENSKIKEEKQFLEQIIDEASLKMAKLYQEIFALKRNYEEAKELIRILEEKLSQYEKAEIKATNYPERNECECVEKDDIDNKSDIINQLQTTIDVLVDRYSALRKSVGMD